MENWETRLISKIVVTEQLNTAHPKMRWGADSNVLTFILLASYPHLAQGRDGEHTPEVPEAAKTPLSPGAEHSFFGRKQPQLAAQWISMAAQQLQFWGGISGRASSLELGPSSPSEVLGEGVLGSLHSCCWPWQGRSQEPANRSIKGLSLTPMGCKWAPERIKSFSSWSGSAGTFHQEGANFTVLSK